MNMISILIFIKFYRDGRRAKFNIVWLETIFGEEVIHLRMIFWVASSLDQLVRDRRDLHSLTAYVTTGRIYILWMFSFDLSDSGLFLLSIGFSRARILFALVTS